jgi:vitamin B12 transporter
MPRYLFSASILAIVAACPQAAFADDLIKPVDEAVVTGTRDPEGVQADRIGGSLSVITARQFEDRQVRIVSDVLRDVPGVAVSRNGAVGNQTQVRIRGTEGNHVLTLIDGIKASDPFFGEFDYATLLADDVARVEVLRGQQSAIYGSDAIGGVINYITPTGRDLSGVRVRAEGGSQGTYAIPTASITWSAAATRRPTALSWPRAAAAISARNWGRWPRSSPMRSRRN